MQAIVVVSSRRAPISRRPQESEMRFAATTQTALVEKPKKRHGRIA